MSSLMMCDLIAKRQVQLLMAIGASNCTLRFLGRWLFGGVAAVCLSGVSAIFRI